MTVNVLVSSPQLVRSELKRLCDARAPVQEMEEVRNSYQKKLEVLSERNEVVKFISSFCHTQLAALSHTQRTAKGQVCYFSFLKITAEGSEGWPAKDQARAPWGRSVRKTVLEVGG